MKKSTLNWRYLALFVMLFSVVSTSYADTNEITVDNSNFTPPTEPSLAITPDPLDLGFWPIGGWQEPAIITLTNDGISPIKITASDIDDAAGIFTLDNEGVVSETPLAVGEFREVGVSFTGIPADGFYEATYVATWDATRSVSTSRVTVDAYTPLTGDIWEDPFDIALPIVGDNVFQSTDFYDNYNMPGTVDGWDAVYKLDFTAGDELLTIALTGADAQFTLYVDGFEGAGGPMAANELYSETTTLTDAEVFTGVYYLVVSTTGTDYTLGLSTSAMPVPDQVIYTAPADGELNVVNGADLEWTFGANTLEYQVILGTTYPPTDVVVAWTSDLAEAYTLVGLENNLQYFWQVNVMNANGSTDGLIYGFTTTISPPLDLTAADEELFEGDEVDLSWDSPIGGVRALLGYNVYRDGVMINTSMLTGTTFTDDDATLVYDMVGYDYNVTSVFDEGESGYSNTVTVQFSGEGTIAGNVSDNVIGFDISGVAIDIVGVDEYGNAVSTSTTTDSGGDYTIDVLVGDDYEVTASADGYIDGVVDPVAVVYASTTTQDFSLLEIAYALDYVVATELNDGVVHLEWGFDIATFVPAHFPFDTEGLSDAQIEKRMIDHLALNGFANAEKFSMDAVASSTREINYYRVYRGQCDDDIADMIYLANIDVTQTQMIDYDWGFQTSGVYKWAIVVVYTNGNSDPTMSNCLDKDMETIVNVEVSLNSAESPEGVNVFLNNVSEPYLELAYDIDLDATGTEIIDPFRKGVYDIKVSFFGYATQIITGVIIDDDASLSYLLVEEISAVQNLYVDPNGYATWNMPVAGGLEEYAADFTGGIPSSLIVTGVGGVWELDYMGESPWGDCAFSDWGYPTPTVTIMQTPKIALDGTTVFQFAWMTDLYNDATSVLYIEISVDEVIWTEIWSSDDDDKSDYTWYETTLDLADLGYTEGDVKFRIIKEDDEGDWYWFDELYIGPAELPAATVAISTPGVLPEGMDKTNFDAAIVMANVTMLPNNLLASTVNSESNRSLENFKVSLDDVFSGNTTDEFYDYEVEETLVEGEEYEAKVEVLYTTGISEAMYYTFIYHACAYYNAAADFTATRVDGTMDIALAWTNDDSDVDEFIGTNVFRDGEFVAFVEVGTETYTDEVLASGDYEYCVTQVYFSDAESCEVCDEVTMTPGGFVNGFVTTGCGTDDPIEGATVAIIGGTDSFIFTTDATGYYEGEVVEGTYDYSVSMEAYETQTLEGVVIDFGATVVNDFVLLEYPYAIAEVVA